MTTTQLMTPENLFVNKQRALNIVLELARAKSLNPDEDTRKKAKTVDVEEQQNAIAVVEQMADDYDWVF